MKLVIQRVKKAIVKAERKTLGKINRGLLVFLGIEEKDKEKDVDFVIKKILFLRIFENEMGKFDKSLLDINGEILLISQFTLLADCSKGNRPFFGKAAKPEIARPLFEAFFKKLKNSKIKNAQKGRFGAKMEIKAVNDGPVTIILDNQNL